MHCGAAFDDVAGGCAGTVVGAVVRRAGKECGGLSGVMLTVGLNRTAGHVIVQRPSQLAGDGVGVEIVDHIGGADEQFPGANVRFEDHAELKVAVPVIDGGDDGLQFWRGFFDIDGADGAVGTRGDHIDPLPVAEGFGGEFGRAGWAALTQRPSIALELGIHLAVPEDRDIIQRRAGVVEALDRGNEEDFPAGGEFIVGGGPIAGDEHIGGQRRCSVVGVEPEFPVVFDGCAFDADDQAIFAGGSERGEIGGDVAQLGATAQGNIDGGSLPWSCALPATSTIRQMGVAFLSGPGPLWTISTGISNLSEERIDILLHTGKGNGWAGEAAVFGGGDVILGFPESIGNAYERGALAEVIVEIEQFEAGEVLGAEIGFDFLLVGGDLKFAGGPLEFLVAVENAVSAGGIAGRFRSCRAGDSR